MADVNKMESMADGQNWFARQIKRMVRSTWKNTFSIWINEILYHSCLLAMNFDFLNIADKNTIANPTAMETTTTTKMETTTTTTTMETTTTTKIAANLTGK